MSNAAKKTVSITGYVIRETDKAIFANVDGCHTSVWIPKSQLSEVCIEDLFIDGKEQAPLRRLTAEIPSWLWYKMPIKTGPVAWATRPW